MHRCAKLKHLFNSSVTTTTRNSWSNNNKQKNRNALSHIFMYSIESHSIPSNHLIWTHKKMLHKNNFNNETKKKTVEIDLFFFCSVFSQLAIIILKLVIINNNDMEEEEKKEMMKKKRA